MVPLFFGEPIQKQLLEEQRKKKMAQQVRRPQKEMMYLSKEKIKQLMNLLSLEKTPKFISEVLNIDVSLIEKFIK